MSLDISELATRIDSAALNVKAIQQLSSSMNLSTEQAYLIQAAVIEKRIERGNKCCGVKMGFTSRAKMIQMGVNDLIVGRLTDDMRIDEGGEINLNAYLHPRVEPEIAFRLRTPITGQIDLIEALNSIDAIAPALEIIDSRYHDFKFSLADVLADNCSSSGFVIGAWQSIDTDIRNLGISLEFNGRPVQVGSTAAILGYPLRSLVEASRIATKAGINLQEGDIVLAGAATAAIELIAGTAVKAQFQDIGSVEFHVAVAV